MVTQQSGGRASALVPMDAVNAGNVEFIEQQYEAYKRDRNSVDPQWAYFFAGFELAAARPAIEKSVAAAGQLGGGGNGQGVAETATKPIVAIEAAELQKGPGRFMQIADLVHSYRELGHLIANLDPLGHNMTHHPLLELSEFNVDESDMERVVTADTFRGGLRAPVREIVRQLHETYCSTFAVEFMDIRDSEQRAWLLGHMEPTLNKPGVDRVQGYGFLVRLLASEDFV